MKNDKTLLFLEQFKEYLNKRDWKQVLAMDYVIIFRKNYPGKVYELTLPKNEAGDCDEILEKTLVRLAKIEKKEPETLRLNILNQYIDTLSIRVSDKSVEDGTIPLNDGVKLFEKTKNLVNALALSAKNKKPFFGNGAGGKDVVDFMEQVRLGQTQIGSYVINLSYPVENITIAERQDEIIKAISFSRRVTHNLLNSLKKLKEKIQNYEKNPVIFAELIPEGVSHNLCEAIVGLSGTKKQREVEIKLQAGEIVDDFITESDFKIKFNPNEIEIVQTASKYFQGEYTLPNCDVVGKIINLHSQNPSEGGCIQVSCLIQGKTIVVKIDLTQEQYKKATEAHKTEKQIQCKGEDLYINRKKGHLKKLISMNTL